MLTKIVIFAYLTVVTKQEPQVLAAPYVANYASSYDAHAVNHDIRVPIAPVAPLVKAAPIAPVASIVNAAPAVQAINAYSPAIASLTSAFPQVLSAYSPGIASYSLAPVAPIAPTAPLTSAIAPVVSSVTKAASLPVINPIQAAIPTVARPQARSNPDSAPIETDERDKPSRSTLLPENSINPAVFLASQFLARNIALQQNNPADPRVTNQGGNSQDAEATSSQDQRNRAILGATATGFGLIQRNNARFAQRPLQRDDNQIQRADLKLGQPQAPQRNAPRADLIRENEDSESVEVGNQNGQAYEPGKAVVQGTLAPLARLATLTPNVGIVPNVYTSYIAF